MTSTNLQNEREYESVAEAYETLDLNKRKVFESYIDLVTHLLKDMLEANGKKV